MGNWSGLGVGMISICRFVSWLLSPLLVPVFCMISAGGDAVVAKGRVDAWVLVWLLSPFLFLERALMVGCGEGREGE